MRWTVVISLFFCATACYNPPPEGERLYERHCASCHMDDGTGLKALFPPLLESDYLSENWNEFSCMIVHGITDTIQVNGTEYNVAMKGIRHLTNADLCNIINYVSREMYSSPKPYVTVTDIQKQLDSCKE